MAFKPAQTGFSRVFLIDGRARPDHAPAYQGTVKAGSISRGFGDIERIEIPSPTEFGAFLEVGTIRGATERATITLTGRYAADLKSELLRLANAGCAFDVQINIGTCTNPTDWNVFTKKIVMESAFITNYDTEDIGALGSDERAKIDESVDVSTSNIYELVQVSWAERAGDVVTNEVIDVVRCDTPSCGDCDEESDGCSKFFAISLAAGGSPGTPADVVFSLDSGVTWDAHDIDTLGAAVDPDAVNCIGAYLVVVSSADEAHHYALLSEFDGTTDPAFTQVTSGYVAGAGPTAIAVSGNVAFIAGLSGYIYKSTDVTSGVTVLDAGVAKTDDYNAIAALSEDFVVAVGNAGAIVKTENGSSFATVTSPVGVGVNLTTVALKDESNWIVGTDDGNLYYTVNAGDTWTLKSFPGSGSGTVEDVIIANETVLYLSHTTTAPLGRILRSTNGGYDWIVMPEGSGVLPANDAVNALASCESNPDIVVGVGLADDAADGFIIAGSD